MIAHAVTLTRPHFVTLSALRVHPERTAAQLAERTGLTIDNQQATLADLVDLEWVRRTYPMAPGGASLYSIAPEYLEDTCSCGDSNCQV